MTDMVLTPIKSPLLDVPGVQHGFFTRQGGVSTGIYASLNGGVGSRDQPEAVAENRRRMSTALGIAPTHLLVPYQIHSADAVVVSAPWAPGDSPRCDGIVTRTCGIGLGVTGADCGMVLFADRENGVIGACHSGWKGALTGVLEATLVAMESVGGRRSTVSAVLGPMIAQPSYEVGAEFVARFVAQDASYARFFQPSAKPGHSMFDLPGFIGMRLQRAGIGAFANLGLDTYADEARFFSYRRTTHRQEPDYGRLVGAIALV